MIDEKEETATEQETQGTEGTEGAVTETEGTEGTEAGAEAARVETDEATSDEAETETTEPRKKTALGEALHAKDKQDDPALQKGGTEASSSKEPAPIEYEDFTLPEGVEISPEEMSRAKEVFGKANLPQETAQEYLDMHRAEVQRTVDDLQKKQWDDWMATRQVWRDTFQSDEEIGGNRANTSIQAGSNLIRSFGTEGLVEAIEQTGLGDHPEFIRFLARLSETHSETSKPVQAEGPPITPEARAARRYTASSEG